MALNHFKVNFIRFIINFTLLLFDWLKFSAALVNYSFFLIYQKQTIFHFEIFSLFSQIL